MSLPIVEFELEQEENIDFSVDNINFTSVENATNFNDLTNRPKYNGNRMTGSTNIPEIKTSSWDGKYTKPNSGIPSTDLSSSVQNSLNKADTALQSETYTGTVTSVGVSMNGASKGTVTTSGVIDLGTVLTEHQTLSDLGVTASATELNYVDGVTSAIQTQIDGKLATSLKGSANGLAELDATGKVPSAQLPSYVDDVLEYDSMAQFPATGESGKIYVAKDTNKTYRWGGSAYVEISPSLALGETSSTAYRGDRGKTAYDHSQATGNPHSTTLGNLGVTATASELNVLDGITASTTELNYVDGVTSGIQGQLNSHSTEIANLTSGKVDKVSGKGLSTNDYDNTEKSKVAKVEPLANWIGYKGNIVDDVIAKGLYTENSCVWISSGDVIQINGYAASDYIDISGITKMSIEAIYGGDPIQHHFCFYRSNHTYISGFDGTSKVYDVPDNAQYIRFNMQMAEIQGTATNYSHYVQIYKRTISWLEPADLASYNALTLKTQNIIANPIDFTGKTLATFGDSIMVGISSDTPDPGRMSQNPWINLFSTKADCTLVNNAIAGSTLAVRSGETTSTYEKVVNYNGATPDVVMIAGGTNDYTANVPIGVLTDTSATTSTIYGVTKAIIERIRSNINANAKIIFITPINRPYVADIYGLKRFNDIRNAIFEVASSYDCSVIDGSTLGFPLETGAYANAIIADGTHPTEQGHKMYANAVAGLLLSNLHSTITQLNCNGSAYYCKIGRMIMLVGQIYLEQSGGSIAIANNLPSALVGNVCFLLNYGDGNSQSIYTRVAGNTLYTNSAVPSSGWYFLNGTYIAES